MMRIKKISKRFIAIALSAAVLLTAAFFTVPALSANVRSMLASTGGGNTRTVTVDTSDVITEDFYGYGSNLWLGPKYTNNMTDAYYEVNYKRIQTMRPAFMRMMFLPNWLMGDLTDKQVKANAEANWTNGVYDTSSSQFQLFSEYVKAFYDAGTVVQLNMGGRVLTEIADWYSIKDVELGGVGSGRSAPRDCRAFAKATAWVIKYFYEQGYDNIKMLSVHNEVNGGNFCVFGDKRIYWAKLFREIDKAFEETKIVGGPHDGETLRQNVTVIGTECSSTSNFEKLYVDYWAEPLASTYLKNGEFDVLSDHYYFNSTEHPGVTVRNTIINNMEYYKNSANASKYPLLITEYNAVTDDGELSDYLFGKSSGAQGLMMSNVGVAGLAKWFFCGAQLDQAIDNVNMNRINAVNWSTPAPTYDEDNNTVSRMGEVSIQYMEESLLMRFVPKHGKTVATSCANSFMAKNSDGSFDVEDAGEGDIIQSAYVSKDGEDLTVVMIVNDSQETRNLNLSITGDKFKNKTFGKYVYEYGGANYDTTDDASAIMPTKVVDKVTNASGVLTDTLPNKYSIVVYTTMAEPVQVELDKTTYPTLEASIKVNETAQFAVANIYGTTNTDVRWEVLTGTDGRVGSIDQNGVYTPADDAQVGDTIAVAAYSAEYSLENNSQAYDVAIVTIVE